MGVPHVVHVVKASPNSDLGLSFIARRGRRTNGCFSICMGGLINERRVHIMVSQVLPGSPSSLAGLSTGDELISVNGEKPDSIVGAVTAVRLANAGTVQLEVVPGSGGQPTAAQLPVAVIGVPVS